MLIINSGYDPLKRVERATRNFRYSSFRLANGRAIKQKGYRPSFVSDNDAFHSAETIINGIKEGRIELMDDNSRPISLEQFIAMVENHMNAHKAEPTKVEPVVAAVKLPEPVKVEEPVKAPEPVKVPEPVKEPEPVKVEEPDEVEEDKHEAAKKSDKKKKKR